MTAPAPRITDVRPLVLRAAVATPVRMAVGQLTARQSVLVYVETDAGLTGVGESWVNYPSWGPTERLATITYGLRPLLLGESLDDPSRIWRKLTGALHKLALQWGAPGPIYQAISGVDIALWDLAGKIADAPIWRLLGGSLLRRVPAYASGLGPDAPEEQASAALVDGFTAVKLKVGFERGADERNLAAVRDRLGAATLYTDANQGWTLDTARAMLPALRATKVTWLEEPLAVDDADGWQAAPAALPLPIAGGENLYTLDQFHRWFAAGRLAVAQPDVCKCGGISAAREILADAATRGLRLAPHFFGGAIGLAATIHLFATLPPALRAQVEYDINANPLRADLLTESLWLGHGHLRVPDRPGLGVTLRMSALARWGE